MLQSTRNQLYYNESNGGSLIADIFSSAQYVQNHLLKALHIATAFPEGSGATSIQPVYWSVYTM